MLFPHPAKMFYNINVRFPPDEIVIGFANRGNRYNSGVSAGAGKYIIFKQLSLAGKIDAGYINLSFLRRV